MTDTPEGYDDPGLRHLVGCVIRELSEFCDEGGGFSPEDLRLSIAMTLILPNLNPANPALRARVSEWLIARTQIWGLGADGEPQKYEFNASSEEFTARVLEGIELVEDYAADFDHEHVENDVASDLINFLVRQSPEWKDQHIRDRLLELAYCDFALLGLDEIVRPIKGLISLDNITKKHWSWIMEEPPRRKWH